MGAWIETYHRVPSSRPNNVAPRVGAWIETVVPVAEFEILKSRPAWARGLKRQKIRHAHQHFVAPRVGAWIETAQTELYGLPSTSRPAWARGLKPELRFKSRENYRSRPAWARGLKPAGDDE